MRKFVNLLTALTIAVLATPTFAASGPGYTTVIYPGFNPEEPNHAQIFSDLYGGTFSGSGTDLDYGMWTQFSNGLITAHRIYDWNEEQFALNIIENGPEDVDQIWTNGFATVTATAKYAALQQSFGWNGGGLGTDYIELLTYEDVGQPGVTFEILGDFLWGIEPYDGAPNNWWSLISSESVFLNPDETDHMATYKITGLETDKTVWMVFWEDLAANESDFDYNDFVVEIRAIPEPTSMLLLGLGALGLLRKRRN